MRRLIEPELLDELPPGDPRAVRSRADLRRINALMGNARLLSGLLLSGLPSPPRRIVELGAGDGTLMLALARRLAPCWPGPVRLQLLDLQPAVHPATLDSFSRLGWQAEVLACDLRDWVRQYPACDLLVANLFLHHFHEPALREFFASFAQAAPAFASCDPRRGPLSLFLSRFLWAIGCNRVTRHDAVVSVRAGFRGAELSSLWPARSGFALREFSASHSSHLFFARRKP